MARACLASVVAAAVCQLYLFICDVWRQLELQQWQRLKGEEGSHKSTSTCVADVALQLSQILLDWRQPPPYIHMLLGTCSAFLWPLHQALTVTYA